MLSARSPRTSRAAISSSLTTATKKKRSGSSPRRDTWFSNPRRPLPWGSISICPTICVRRKRPFLQVPCSMTRERRQRTRSTKRTVSIPIQEKTSGSILTWIPGRACISCRTLPSSRMTNTTVSFSTKRQGILSSTAARSGISTCAWAT